MILAMQKPNVTAEGMNLWPRAIFIRNRVMWHTAPVTKIARKTAVMGTSAVIDGRPPIAAIGGG